MAGLPMSGTKAGPTNVTNQLLPRELANRVPKPRVLLGGRVGGGSSTAGVIPRVFNLPLRMLPSAMTREPAPDNNWLQICTENQKRLQVEIADRFLFSSCTKPKKGEQNNYTHLQQFYACSRGDFQFELVFKQATNGRVIKTAMLNYVNNVTSRSCNYLIALTEENQIWAYDLDRRATVDMRLLMEVGDDHSVESTVSFTDFAIAEEDQRILVMQTDRAQNLKAIVVMEYPHAWTMASILHINIPELQLEIRNEMAVITHGLHHFTMGPLRELLNSAFPIVPAAAVVPLDPSPFFINMENEMELNVLPRYEIDQMMPSYNFHYLESTPPLLYAKMGLDICFFTLDSQIPAFRISGMTQDEEDYGFRVLPFPDKSPRLVVSNAKMGTDSTIKLITKEEEQRINGIRENLFVDKNRDFSILAMAFCPKSNVIAVLYGKHFKFQVKFFDDATRSMIRAMDVVDRQFTSVYDTVQLKSARIEMNEEFVLVNFEFNDGIYDPKSEVYAGRLLSETIFLI